MREQHRERGEEERGKEEGDEDEEENKEEEQATRKRRGTRKRKRLRKRRRRRRRWSVGTMRTWVMEDNVGDIVGENCLGCCRLQSPATGRDRGLSGTRRRGEVAAKEPPSPEGRLGLLGEDWRGWLRGDVGSEGLESEEDREEGRDWLEREEGMEELLWEDWSEGLLREAWSEGLRREAWRLGLLREDCRDGLLRELCRGEGSPVGTKTESTVTPPGHGPAPRDGPDGAPGGMEGDGATKTMETDTGTDTHPGQGDGGVRGHRERGEMGSSQTPARPLTPSDPME